MHEKQIDRDRLTKKTCNTENTTSLKREKIIV